MVDGAFNTERPLGALRAPQTCTLTLTHGALKVDRLLSKAGQCKEPHQPNPGTEGLSGIIHGC